MSSKGMNEAQKTRMRGYLDDFRKRNGGCIVCGQKISPLCYFADADVNDENMRLTLYGLCDAHARQCDCEQAVADNIATRRLDARPKADSPRMIVVTYKPSAEELQYA